VRGPSALPVAVHSSEGLGGTLGAQFCLETRDVRSVAGAYDDDTYPKETDMGRLIWLLALLPVLAHAQTLAVKTGAWETTTKSPMLPRPAVEKDCVTKADLEELAKGGDQDEDESCKLVKPPTVSGKKWAADRKCADGRTVHAEFIAESAERVIGTIVTSAPKGGAPVRIELSSRWISASCAGLK